MKRPLTAIVAVSIIAVPSAVECLTVGPDSRPVTWQEPRDVVEHASSRVLRHTTYQSHSVNLRCPFARVAAVHYSLVTEAGENLADIIYMFQEAGVPDRVLERAANKWKNYRTEAETPDWVFNLGHPDKCPY